MFKRILLAGDGSAHSLRACEKAVYLAKQTEGSSITLIHVVDDIPSRSDVMDEEMKLRDIPDHRKQRVFPLQEMIHKETIPLTVKHTFGDPGPTIVREANDGNYDVVVIGSRGLNQFQQMVLGSVSHKVAKRASCPVLLVK
ncbi:universal stress protein [Salipaludibacillus aurantiacus]|uniref:Nucleotide-binding universal stress protein, UspA family n=1 Tax=Salipaludibacillus aurantiacus TaxID=1601833 RepID=A0A1H9WF79_9BACI|nr:universal stress protein [Salipaludibacillus aurantiacus]SES32582.1 Nucleotide-binding universal stress protein, UspA family [Salipaludibacillus aurantiacus]